MTRPETINKIFCRILQIGIPMLFYLSPAFLLQAQELPPRPMEVYVNPAQQLSFGAFSISGLGGNIQISPQGVRSRTGDIFLLNLGFSWSSALFDISANPGTLVSIQNGPNATLHGSNGGTMTLIIGETDHPNPFVINTIPPVTTSLRMGGTLVVGNPIANPPGNYSGTFTVIFHQE